MAESYTDFCATNASFFVKERKLIRYHSATSDLRSTCTGGEPVSRCSA